MKRAKAILAVVLLTPLVAWELYTFVFVDKGLEYYATDTSRVIPVVLMTLIGGAIMFAYYAVSVRRKWQMRVAGLLILATVATGMFIYGTYVTVRLHLLLQELGFRLRLTAMGPVLACGAVTVGLWYAALRQLRRTPPKQGTQNS